MVKRFVVKYLGTTGNNDMVVGEREFQATEQNLTRAGIAAVGDIEAVLKSEHGEQRIVRVVAALELRFAARGRAGVGADL